MKIDKINIDDICEILLNFNKCLKFGKTYKINQISCVGNPHRESVIVYHNKDIVCEIDSALCFCVVLQKFYEFELNIKILIDTIIRDNAVFTHKINNICLTNFSDNQRLRMPKNANTKNQS